MRLRSPARRRIRFRPNVLTPSSWRSRWNRSSPSGSIFVYATPVSIGGIIVARVLFKLSQLEGIADGSIDLTFRRWDVPRVRAGGQQRTNIGVIEFDTVERVDDLTDEEARRAGWASRDAVMKQFASRRGDLYRIELHLAGPDPRAVLRERVPDDAELAALRRRVDRMGPWAVDYLQAIAERPGVRAPDLAESFGMKTRAFKLRVRRLKELGLTESLRIGYRLSPRGEVVLRQLRS